MNKHKKKLHLKISIAVLFAVFGIFFAYAEEKTPEIKNQNIPAKVIETNTKLVVPSPKINNKQKTQTVNSKVEKVAEQKTEEIKNTQENIKENKQSVTVLTGDTAVHLSFTPNTLFYDALVQAKNQGQIAFDGKNYPALGFFVTDIGTLSAGSGKDLLYYINGKEATVGVSSYTLKDGDIIEWKLE